MGMNRSGRPGALAWALAILCIASIGWFDQLLRQAGRTCWAR
jgi:hypothetical protein